MTSKTFDYIKFALFVLAYVAVFIIVGAVE